ncbi:MAG: uncharacterized protein PWP70_218 [Moorella sp. (in: firmicutes)]|nr:uncharacterized protein [Moorella sp. (in: firmicutes)]
MAAEEVRTEGRTVAEAIRQAAAILEVLPEDLEVEVVQHESNGFLGIGRRPAVIIARRAGEPAAGGEGASLSPEEDAAAPRIMLEAGGEETLASPAAGVERTPGTVAEPGADNSPVITTVADAGAGAGMTLAAAGEDVDQPGYAWVEGGRVQVGGGEPPATIIAGDQFDLYVNGQQVAGEATVRSGDKVEVRPRVETEKAQWKLTISGDGLAARLVLKPGFQKTWRLKDQFPAARLQLEGEGVARALPALTREELLAELQRQQVVFGIDEEAIRQALTATEAREIIVARGRPPQPGEDGRVECLFPTAGANRVEVGEEERVDYREMVVRASAATGDLLAVKVLPRPGKPGQTVTGKVITPPEPRDVELVAGKGTEVIDGQRCVAREEGQPQLHQRRGQVVIDIIPVLLHRGDVDLASGNLKFKGGINITGNVTETMQVAASQDVEISGDVTQATVKAGGSIIIRRNCIGSTLVAGGVHGVYQSVEPLLADLAQQLPLLQTALQQLERGASRQRQPGRQFNTGYLVNILVENKFKKIPAQACKLEQLTKGVQGGPQEQRLVQLAQELVRAFRNPAAMQGLGSANLERLITGVREMAAYCREIPQDGGHITLNYALNSKLQASGQVKVTGRGCFNTEIIAGGKVEIHGVFRGGSIYASDDVFAQEVGSSGGARTLIRVAEGKTIKAGKIWTNCTLQVGKRIRQIDKEESLLMAYLNHEGDLVLGTF